MHGKGARLRVRTIFCLILKIKFRCALRRAHITSIEQEFAAGLSGSFIFFSRDPVPNGLQRAERSRGAAPDLGAPVAPFMCLRGAAETAQPHSITQQKTWCDIGATRSLQPGCACERLQWAAGWSVQP